MKSFDWTIFICILILCAAGLAIIGSVAPAVLLPQIVFYLLGLVCFLLFSKINHRIYPSVAKISYIISLFLLFSTIVMGFESRGSIRWIQIGEFRLQFSELLKPILIVVMASFLAHKPKGLSAILQFLILALIPTALVFRQPDLGSALVYTAGFLVMLFLSGAEIKYLLSLFTAGLLVLPFGWHLLANYQKNRVLTFFQPGFDPLGAGYNAIQAVIAVGSGMLWGRGLGRGTQSHLLFLPEHHTDFVFASIAEEFGFTGGFLILAIYFVLIWKVFSLAGKCSDKAGSLFCVGIGTILFSQVLINVGMNLGLLPVTGITLPFISYGGSSILATMIGLGIVENIATLSKQDESNIIGI